MTVYKNCSSCSALLNKMAARAINRKKSFKWLLLLNRWTDFEIIWFRWYSGERPRAIMALLSIYISIMPIMSVIPGARLFHTYLWNRPSHSRLPNIPSPAYETEADTVSHWCFIIFCSEIRFESRRKMLKYITFCVYFGAKCYYLITFCGVKEIYNILHWYETGHFTQFFIIL